VEHRYKQAVRSQNRSFLKVVQDFDTILADHLERVQDEGAYAFHPNAFHPNIPIARQPCEELFFDYGFSSHPTHPAPCQYM
jgi:hypothetical protein